MRIGSTLLLRHGHNNTIGDFQDNLQNIYKSFQDSADSMTRLAKTKIYYPENCFRRLADRARLATGAVDKYIENEFIPGIAYTAYDLYFMLWHVIGYLKEKSLESQMMTEESIARLQTMDFSKFDRPESVA